CDEVSPAHPLMAQIREQERHGGRVLSLSLAPLDREQTAELIADALSQPRESVTQLADVVFCKTEGNPFFVRQFLRSLHSEGRIRFDAATRSFAFDLPSI